MPYADVRGQRLYYQDSGGKGPAVIFSHGFLMDHRMFDHQVRVLRDTHRVICWDERGFGQTEWKREAFSYWDSADDLFGLLDHLGIEKAILGGMSQGGFLSLRAALRAPDRVRGLILISTQAGVDPPEVIAGYKQMMETWLGIGPIDPLVESIASIILGHDKSHWEPWVSDWRRGEKEDFKWPTLCLLERDDITERVSQIQAPALLVHGMVDNAIPMARAEQLMSLLPNARDLIRVEGAAHAPNLTHPDAVNPAIVSFCSSLG